MDTVEVPAPGAPAELDDYVSTASTASSISSEGDADNTGDAPSAPVGEAPPAEESDKDKSRWVDEVEETQERVEAPTQEPGRMEVPTQVPPQDVLFSSRSSSMQPPSEPVRRSEPPAAPAKIPIGPPYRLDVLEQKLRQVEDVMSRFQLLLDVREQAIGRLDDETQRLSAFQGKSKNIVNELRTQMSVMVRLMGQVVGPEKMSSAMQEMSAQAKLEGGFRGKPDSARFRQGGGPGPDYGGQQWQQGGPNRGADGGSGYGRSADGGNAYGRGADGGSGYSRSSDGCSGFGRGGGNRNGVGGFRGGGGRGGRRVHDT